MSNPMYKALAFTTILAMAACGSSGGSSTSRPDTGDTGGNGGSSDGPASGAVADLVAFAQDGNSRRQEGGIVNHENATAAGRSLETFTLDGTKSGLLVDTKTGRKTRVEVIGKPVINTNTPGGVYTGGFALSYRMDPSSDWQQLEGDMAIELDMASGRAFMDSIGGNASNNIEVMGALDYDKGRLSSDNVRVNVRDADGSLDLNGNGRTDDDVWGDFGKADAILVDKKGKQAIFGKLTGEHDSGFSMEGALVLPRSDEFN